MAQQQFYVKRGARVFGPFSSQQLRDRASRRVLHADDQISKDQHAWVLAAKVKGLFNEVNRDALPQVDRKRPGTVDQSTSGPGQAISLPKPDPPSHETVPHSNNDQPPTICPRCTSAFAWNGQTCLLCGFHIESDGRPMAPGKGRLADAASLAAAASDLAGKPSRFETTDWALPRKHYGGIGRTKFFFQLLGVNGLSSLGGFTPVEDVPATAFLVLAVLIGAVVWLFVSVVNRLRNIGLSGWWSLLILFWPIGTVLVNIPCLVFPEGYRDTRQLDTAGKTVVGLIVGSVLLVFLLVAVATLTS